MAYAKRDWAEDAIVFLIIFKKQKETETGSTAPTDFIPIVFRYDQGGALDLTM